MQHCSEADTSGGRIPCAAKTPRRVVPVLDCVDVRRRWAPAYLLRASFPWGLHRTSLSKVPSAVKTGTKIMLLSLNWPTRLIVLLQTKKESKGRVVLFMVTSNVPELTYAASTQLHTLLRSTPLRRLFLSTTIHSLRPTPPILCSCHAYSHIYM